MDWACAAIESYARTALTWTPEEGENKEGQRIRGEIDQSFNKKHKNLTEIF